MLSGCVAPSSLSPGPNYIKTRRFADPFDGADVDGTDVRCTAQRRRQCNDQSRCTQHRYVTCAHSAGFVGARRALPRWLWLWLWLLPCASAPATDPRFLTPPSAAGHSTPNRPVTIHIHTYSALAFISPSTLDFATPCSSLLLNTSCRRIFPSVDRARGPQSGALPHLPIARRDANG